VGDLQWGQEKSHETGKMLEKRNGVEKQCQEDENEGCEKNRQKTEKNREKEARQKRQSPVR
jgi:hypothetical protein